MLDVIHIEPTNRCLLHCTCCGDKKTRRVGNMTLKNFRNIAQQAYDINPKVGVRLFLSGDPLLHPKIAKICKIAREEVGLTDISIHTPGYALTEELTEALIAAPLPKISFSLDAYHIKKSDKGTYVGWEALRKILYFIEKNTGRVNRTEVTVQSLATTSAEVKIYQKIHAKHLSGADLSVIKRPHSWDVRGSVPGALRTNSKTCKFLKRRAAIYWNGDTAICCADLNGKTNLGNVFKGDVPLTEIIELVEQAGKVLSSGGGGLSNVPCFSCERYL